MTSWHRSRAVLLASERDTATSRISWGSAHVPNGGGPREDGSRWDMWLYDSWIFSSDTMYINQDTGRSGHRATWVWHSAQVL